MTRNALVGGLCALGLLAACGPATGCAGPPPGPAWTEVALADGPPSVALGDLARCGDRWYASGALRRPVPHPDLAAGEPAVATAPALWSSPDGRDWRPAPLAPVSYYGAQQVLTALACHDGEIAALGAKPGGAHDNPRVSSWRPHGGGLAEVDGPVELYGGPRAITVSSITGGPGGWLVAGNRVGADGGPTAAVWLSGDAVRFTKHADAAGLASTPDTVTTARGAAAGGAGWLVFGDTRAQTSIVRAPALWTSPDGLTWRAGPPPPAADARISTDGSNSTDGSISAIGVDGDRVLAMGTRGGVPHGWYRDARGWTDTGDLSAGSGTGVARVGQVVLTPADAYAAVDDGARWSLWRSSDLRRWQPVPLPAGPPSGADSRLRVEVSGDLLAVAGSDTTGAHLWVAARPR